MRSFRCGEMKLREMLQGPRCDRRRFVLDSEAAERGEQEELLKPCPICGMEVAALIHPDEGGGDGTILVRVREQFPGWQPEEGMCDSCLDRYEGAGNGVAGRR